MGQGADASTFCRYGIVRLPALLGQPTSSPRMTTWQPTKASRAWIRAITDVLEADRLYWPLTVRYVWYRLIGQTINGEVVKKDASAPGRVPRSLQKIQEKLNRGRRAGIFPWEAITDGGVVEQGGGGYNDPADFWSSQQWSADRYRRSLLQGQPGYIELWCEAAGMVPRMARSAEPYGITVFSGGGQNSTSMKHDAARRIIDDGRPATLLHIGDLDEHGEMIFDAVFSDVPQFVEDYGHSRPQVVRLSVTPAQVEEYSLPTDEKGQFQAEAFPAADMDAVVRTALDGLIDTRILEKVKRQSEEERKAIRAVMRTAAAG